MTLTSGDLEKIDSKLNILRQDLVKKIDAKLDVFRLDLNEKIDEKLTELRSDFYEKIDPILKEVVASREERAIWSRKLIDHDQRIADLQSIHPNNDHPSSVN